MDRPVPKDFGISDTAVDEVKRLRRTLIVLALAWSVLGLSIGAYFDIGALAIAVAPPYGPLIFYYLAKSIVRAVVPRFRRALAYEAALQRYEEWWVRTKSEFWRGLSGSRFELDLANLYRRLGCGVERTTIGTDKGVDIWIVRNGNRLPVQCKAHRRPVSPGAARELYGTMQHFRVSAGVLASVSGFTRGVSEYASGKGIELLDLSAILHLQRQIE